MAETTGPGNDNLYDFNNFYVDPNEMDLDLVAKSLVKFHTITNFKTPTEELIAEVDGHGVSIGDYIITVRHTASHDVFYTPPMMTPFGLQRLPVPAEKKEDKSFLVLHNRKILLERFIEIPEKDILVFKKPKGIELFSFPYVIGNSDTLKTGNFIYVVGVPLNMQYHVRHGIIGSSLAPPEKSKEVLADLEVGFMIAAPISPGDSGTPIIAIRDGKFELVGLTQGIYTNISHVAWGIKINTIMGVINGAEKESQQKQKIMPEM